MRPITRPYYLFNMQFRPYCNSMCVGNWIIERVADYDSKQALLSNQIEFHGVEFSGTPTIGQNAVTGTLTCTVAEPPSTSALLGASNTAIDDIVILLRLFTGREVAYATPEAMEDENLLGLHLDHRQYGFGKVIRTSIPYVKGPNLCPSGLKWKDESVEAILNKLLATISDKEWLDVYHNGAFLGLLEQAIKQRTITSAFTQCWTIWEHLFFCLNCKWMSEQTIRKTRAEEKIAFILQRHGILYDIDKKCRDVIQRLVNTRNRLVHHGLFPDTSEAIADALLFVDLTEYVAVKAMNLIPGEVFNTLEQAIILFSKGETFYHRDMQA